jgi:hypothetical protein
MVNDKEATFSGGLRPKNRVMGRLFGVSGSCGCSGGDDVCGGSDGDGPAQLSPQPALMLEIQMC